jgi:ElaB/YqjD/DUF883 family membrane-anchored ribosome-binding protein
MRAKTVENREVDLGQFLDDIRAVVRDGQELLKTGLSGVKERALAGIQITDRALHESPYQPIGLAFGIGIIVGIVAAGMLTRRSDSVDI